MMGQLKSAFLTSRLGRRMFLLFVACALLPMAALSAVCFHYVRTGLETDASRRLHVAAKSVGLGFVERAAILVAALRSDVVPRGAGAGVRRWDDGDTAAGLSIPFLNTHTYPRGSVPALPGGAALDHDATLRLAGGRPVLTALPVRGRAARLFLVVPRDRDVIVAELDADALWTSVRTGLSATTELVLTDGTDVIASTIDDPAPVLAGIRSREDAARPGRFWHHDEEYVVGAWPLYLRAALGVSEWTIAIAEPRAAAWGPVIWFSRVLPLFFVLSVAVASLLSIRQIRRSLVPLEALKEATDRLATGAFATRVEVVSRDEFGDVAAAFNDMAGRIERQFRDLDRLHWEALSALARAIDAKSPWTAGHSQRVTEWGVRIARHMGLAGRQLDVLQRGGLLHDIGKIGVPAHILDKPGPLTPEEMSIMREHPMIGARILEPLSAFVDAIPAVRHHHEHWNGRGYPDGLAGETIPLSARIYAVADVWDALMSDRPYRSGWERDRVVAFIREGAGAQFDPHVVKAFLELVEQDERQFGEFAASFARHTIAAKEEPCVPA